MFGTMRSALIIVTGLLILVSLPHALEDFHYGDLTKIGIAPPYGIAALITAYVIQLTGIDLTLRSRPWGIWLLGGMGVIWCLGAVVIHGHDLLFAGPHYRHGSISRLLEVAIIGLGLMAAVISMLMRKASPTRRD